MDQGPLVMEEIDAGEQLLRQFDRYDPVLSAFWLKAVDEEQRYLYIASEGIDDTNFDLGYGEVMRIANLTRSMYLNPFRVKLVYANDPLTKHSVRMRKQFPGRMPIRFGGMVFGGISVDDGYIYPPLLPETSNANEAGVSSGDTRR